MSTIASRLLLALVAALALPHSTVSAEETQSGLVAKVDPPDGRYYLLRVGARGGRIDRPIVVLNGDEIHLDDQETQLTLHLIGETEEVIISRFNAPYTVKASSPNESMREAVSKTGRAILSWFVHELLPREQERRLTRVNIRGSRAGFSSHLFDKPQRIAAGRRNVVVGWNPAKGTSVIVVIRPLRGKPIITASTTEHFWTSPILDFKPGLYEFEFRSEPGGDRKTVLVEAIDPGVLPRSHIDLGSQAIGEDLRTTLEAGVLASQGEGTFALEALQAVSPLSARLPAAKLLQDALIDGTWTDKPP